MWCFEQSLALPFFGTGMKTDLFLPVTTAEFSKFAGLLSAPLSQNHFLRFESAGIEFEFEFEFESTGIPSPPLVLFVVMLPKTHLTLHSRMSGSS